MMPSRRRRASNTGKVVLAPGGLSVIRDLKGDAVSLELMELESRLSRRDLVKRTGAAGLGLSSLGALLAACGSDDSGGGGQGAQGDLRTVRWISPRGTLEVMDDYMLWLPIKQGYFDDLKLKVELIGGPIDATATTKFVAEDEADVGFPSPGVLTSSIDAGVPVTSVWQLMPKQTFAFSFPVTSSITDIKQLSGKTIAVGSAAWKSIIDPMLVQGGVDPDTVKLADLGQQWSQAVARGQADAGLAWEGLRAQLLGQGLKLKFLLGSKFSSGPSNVYSIRRADLDDARLRDVYQRFFQGVVMGFEFTKANPRAAAQITYRQFPALGKTLTPQVALESMLQQLAVSKLEGKPWGYHDVGPWEDYLDVTARLEQTTDRLDIKDVLTNDLVEPVNNAANVDRARKDAQAFELDSDFADTRVPKSLLPSYLQSESS
jgi:NitT/TauT family transport system substrate-binding protein